MEDLYLELIEERRIVGQLKAYCRAMDRCDRELGRSVFHPDATVDYGEMFAGSGYDFVDFAIEAHQGFETHLHRLSNVIVDLDGARAGSEAYVDAQFRLTRAGVSFDQYARGRYVDTWEKRAGGWAIVERKYLNAMSGRRPIEEVLYATAGTRTPLDPSYAVLRAGGARPAG